MYFYKLVRPTKMEVIMGWNYKIKDLYNKEIKRRESLPYMRRKYEEYERNFIKNDGLESDCKLLTYEEFKAVNEKEDSDDY